MTRRELWRSLRLLFRRAAADAEFSEELAYHAEMRARELVASGVAPGAARRRAESEMGGTTRLKQDLRDVHGIAFAGAIDAVRTDVRVAWRRLSRTPGFTAAMILSVAIAVGANATIYSAVRSLLLDDSLGVDRIDRVVWLSSSARGEAPAGGLLDWEARAAGRSSAFSSVAVIGDRSLVRHVGSRRSRWHGLWVTRRLAEVLHARPVLGRAFTEADVGAAPVMMIGYERWVTDFGADSAIVGQVVHFIDNKSFTVVGILPPRLEFPFGLSPRAGNGAGYRTGVQDFWFLTPGGPDLPGGVTIARLADGVSLERARAAAVVTSGQRPVGADSLRTMHLSPVREQALGIAAPGLRLAQAFAVLMLVLASANMTNLMLLRLRARSSEFAILAALGGSRRAVARMVVVESLMLVVAGAAAGCLAATYSSRLLGVLSAGTMPLLDHVRMDWGVAAYAAGAAAVVAVICGVAPAAVISRQPIAAALSIGSRSVTDDRRMRRFRAALVVAQVAIAFVLGIGAGLITTSFGRLSGVDTGYDPEGVLVAEIEVFDHPNVAEYYRQLDRRLRAIPGVEAVGLIHSTPLTGKWSFTSPFGVPGKTYGPQGPPQVAGSFVAFDYFGAMSIPIVAGRSFIEAEYTGGHATAIMINESAARRFFPNETALDRMATLDGKPRRIVGIVKDTRDVRLDAAAEPLWYEPVFGAGNQLMIRASRPVDEVLPVVRRELLASDPGLVIEQIGPFAQVVAGTLTERRLAMRLVTILASLSAALCIVGLYGVLGFAVRLRRREFGVRRALGAPGSVLLAGVVRSGLSLAAAGIALGIIAAAGTTRLIASLLYDLSPLDPRTFAGMAVVFALTAGAASLLPALSAMRTDPLIALRDQ